MSCHFPIKQYQYISRFGTNTLVPYSRSIEGWLGLCLHLLAFSDFNLRRLFSTGKRQLLEELWPMVIMTRLGNTMKSHRSTFLVLVFLLKRPRCLQNTWWSCKHELIVKSDVNLSGLLRWLIVTQKTIHQLLSGNLPS